MSYRIIADTCCDFPQQMYEELNITAIPLCVRYQGAEHDHYTDQWLKDMYNGLRNGETASTSAVNPDGWANAMEPVLKEGRVWKARFWKKEADPEEVSAWAKEKLNEPQISELM